MKDKLLEMIKQDLNSFLNTIKEYDPTIPILKSSIIKIPIFKMDFNRKYVESCVLECAKIIFSSVNFDDFEMHQEKFNMQFDYSIIDLPMERIEGIKDYNYPLVKNGLCRIVDGIAQPISIGLDKELNNRIKQDHFIVRWEAQIMREQDYKKAVQISEIKDYEGE